MEHNVSRDHHCCSLPPMSLSLHTDISSTLAHPQFPEQEHWTRSPSLDNSSRTVHLLPRHLLLLPRRLSSDSHKKRETHSLNNSCLQPFLDTLRLYMLLVNALLSYWNPWVYLILNSDIQNEFRKLFLKSGMPVVIFLSYSKTVRFRLPSPTEGLLKFPVNPVISTRDTRITFSARNYKFKDTITVCPAFAPKGSVLPRGIQNACTVCLSYLRAVMSFLSMEHVMAEGWPVTKVICGYPIVALNYTVIRPICSIDV